jgi:hypothetical protein
MSGRTYTNWGADTGSNNTGCKDINVYNHGGGGILHNSSGDLYNKDKGRGDGSGALQDCQKGAHRYIPMVNEDDVIWLGCENVNSLSLFHSTKSKMCTLITLHQRQHMNGACIVEHEINFKMGSSRLSAGHKIHELHNQY